MVSALSEMSKHPMPSLARRALHAVVGHHSTEWCKVGPAGEPGAFLVVVCSCGGATRYDVELRERGTWRENEHHEFVESTCSHELSNRRRVARNLASSMPVATARSVDLASAPRAKVST